MLAGEDPGDAVLAGRDHADLVGRLRWESRRAVLAAARAQVAVERRQRRARGSRPPGAHGPVHRAGQPQRVRVLAGGRADGRPGDTALLLLDVDGFKVVNDTHGHDVGDDVLRQVGAVLRTHLRPGDLAVRTGGDEFAVLIADSHLAASVVLERGSSLRETLRKQPWGQLADGLSVTVSVGAAVAALGQGRPSTPAALYKLADEALYVGKRDGSGLGLAP